MAGLNKEQGEFVPELGKFYHISDVRLWVGSPYFELAVQHAADTFARAKGTSEKVRIELDDILVQQYPMTDKMVFFFVHMVQGKEHYTHYELVLQPEGVEFLKSRGLWPETMMPTTKLIQ